MNPMKRNIELPARGGDIDSIKAAIVRSQKVCGSRQPWRVMIHVWYMNTKEIISQIPEEEITPTIADLLEIIQNQSEEIQALRDEIAKLKGQKPKIKPSNLDKKTKSSS